MVTTMTRKKVVRKARLGVRGGVKQEAKPEEPVLPQAVIALLESFNRERKAGRFQPVTYAWYVGIYIKDRNGWRLVFEKNTRPGLQQIADLVEVCDQWNVPFSVYVNEPGGMRALDTFLDVPGYSDRAKQRACVELSKGHLVDLMEWLDTYLPRANLS